MNTQFWLFGLIAELGSGETPVIFHFEPLEVVVQNEKYSVVNPNFKIMDNLLKSLPLEAVEQWFTSSSSDKQNVVFYTFLSTNKERVETAIKTAELILRCVGAELAGEMKNDLVPAHSPV